MEIKLFEEDGHLWFSYRETFPVPVKHPLLSYHAYQGRGVIPKGIIAQGDKATRIYAWQQAMDDIDRQKKEARLKGRFLQGND